MFNKKILYTGLAIIILVVIIGIIVQKNKPKEEIYTTPPPEEVVRQYFTAWSNKDYPNMYATISDGFKRIDPNAKDLATFKEYAGSQPVESLNIISIQEKSNDGNTATVDYSVEFTLNDGSTRRFDGTFTSKYRQGDIIQGWKLVHPYGDHIDVS